MLKSILFVNRKLIIDLDGTLIDDSNRHWSIFKDLAKIEIEEKRYWDYRRSGLSNRELFKHLTGVDRFRIQEFKTLVEKRDYLKLDKLIITHQKLSQLSKFFELILCSVRSQEENFYWQLERLGIGHFFSTFVIIPHSELIRNRNYYKAPALLERFSFMSGDFIIGDTEVDIYTGKQLGIKTVAVLSGIRTRILLQTFNPDFIIDNINSFELID